VAAIMERFDFLFGAMLGELILKHTDNLSKTLQKDTLSAAEGQECAALTTKTLQSIRFDKFDLFWDKVTMAADKLELEAPSLPRKRKRPKIFESGTAQAKFFDSPKAYLKVSYFEALDLVIMAIKERFDQPGFKVYCNLQELVTKAAKGEKYDKEYDFVVSFYA